MRNNKTIRVFLGSSITELEDERLKLADYINNTVAPILENGGWNIHLFKCNDDPSGNFGGSSQKVIDKELLHSDISVFLFKKNAGEKTIHEFDLARELQLQEERKHGIYVYCFEVPENEKSIELIAFQQRLKKEEFYWHTCEDIDSLERQFLPGLLKQLFGEKAASVVDKRSDPEKDGDARFREYKDNEKKQSMLRERLHQDIKELLKQIQVTIGDESLNIAVKITKVIELYKKADQWAAFTDYDKEKYSDLLFTYALFLNYHGLYKDAESVYLRQIPLVEELYGPEHENTANSYNNIGVVYREQGKYDKALDCHLKALAIREKVLGTEHSDTAASYNNIGVVYDNKGNYEEALEYYFKAMKMVKKNLGAEHQNTASSYNNIGSVYHKQGNYNEALKYFRKALKIDKKLLGEEHPDTATDYNQIGVVYYYQGDYQKALEYFEKAYSIQMKALGPQHPDTKNTLVEIYNAKKLLGIINQESEK